MKEYQKRKDYQNNKKIARYADTVYNTLKNYNHLIESQTRENAKEFYRNQKQNFLRAIQSTELYKDFGGLYCTILEAVEHDSKEIKL